MSTLSTYFVCYRSIAVRQIYSFRLLLTCVKSLSIIIISLPVSGNTAFNVLLYTIVRALALYPHTIIDSAIFVACEKCVNLVDNMSKRKTNRVTATAARRYKMQVKYKMKKRFGRIAISFP